MRYLVLIVSLLMVAACKEEIVQNTDPVPMSDDALGHYCQMIILEHDGPKAQAHLAGLPGAPLFFSQVRDAVAFTRMPEQSYDILAVWVSDMGAPGATWDMPGATNWIAATDAVYVVGGEVVGGMGAPELVPFSRPEDAADFAARNGGAVMALSDIPDSAVLAPVVLVNDSRDDDYQERLRALSRKNGD